MFKRILTVSLCVLSLAVASLAAPKEKMAAAGVPDKAYLQKVLDGWSSLDAANLAQYYAKGDMMFFDIAPLKYANWAEYQKGSTDLLKGYKSVKLTLDDDAQIHHEGEVTWVAATVKEDAMTTAGKHELATFRWTVIFQKEDGKWMIVHEHTSEPIQ